MKKATLALALFLTSITTYADLPLGQGFDDSIYDQVCKYGTADDNTELPTVVRVFYSNEGSGIYTAVYISFAGGFGDQHANWAIRTFQYFSPTSKELILTKYADMISKQTGISKKLLAEASQNMKCGANESFKSTK